jgi:hypothetical protein
MCSCVQFNHPNANSQIDPSLAVVLIGLHYMLYGQSMGVFKSMLFCDQCFRGWHMGCFMPPLKEVIVGK